MQALSRRWRDIALVLFTFLSIICAYLNMRMEGIASEYMIRATSAWSAGPILLLVAYVVGRMITKDPTINFKEISLLAVAFSGTYLFYVTTGPRARDSSDPAAGMYLIFVQLFLWLAAVVVLSLAAWHVVRAKVFGPRKLTPEVEVENQSDGAAEAG